MRTIIAANWKMFKTRPEALDTARKIKELLTAQPVEDREVIVFAPFTAIASAAEGFSGSGIAVGAQDLYPAREGAFTGEISPEMIRECGASWVLTGHSERRHIIGESSALVGQKTSFAIHSGLSVMLCIGETLEEREAEQLESVLRSQLEAAVRGLEDMPSAYTKLAIAYEPVWAIGTGKVASADDILEAHALVRRLLSTIFGSPAASLPILYGGSVKPENASRILALDNVDGLLVGGASLKAESFDAIIHA